MALEHITRADDPTLLPLARSKITSIRASGLKWGSQRLIVGSAIVTAQVKGRQSYISVEGYGGTNLIEMDSGIIDVGAIVVTPEHGERFLAGERRYIPEYEHIFNLPIGNTSWWVHLRGSGQIAGVISLGAKIVGRVRKDTEANAFSPRTYDGGKDESGNELPRVVDGADQNLVDKKRAAVFCPPSMFTGRARLYAQAMYGRALYVRGKEPQDALIPTPGASFGRGDPGLLLLDYAGSGNYVRMNFNTGVFLDPVTKSHWLLCPTLGSITIYPLIADEMGERARFRLKQGKLNDEDTLHLEAYILASCRPDISRAVTLSITEITPWASGYGWHWNWSGTTADMVRVYASDPYDQSWVSTHYRLTASGTVIPDYDPADPKYTPGAPEYIEDPTRSGDTKWEAQAFTVSGPHRFIMVTPVCCVVHPNWTNLYFGEDLEHAPIYRSEKLTVNPNGWAVYFDFSDVPLYAFYKKDELQVVRFSFSIGGETRPGSLDYSPGYVSIPDPNSPTSYFLERKSIGNDSAYLRVTYQVSGLRTYTLTCGSASVSVHRGGNVRDMYIEDTEKTVIQGPPPLSEVGYSDSPYEIILRSGRPLEDGSYETSHIYRTGDMAAAYNALTQYSVSMYTSTTATTQKVWHGNCGGVIPFYDAEAFYLMEDTWREHEDLSRSTQVRYNQALGHDGGQIISGGGAVSYVGWTTFELLVGAAGFEDAVYTPDEVTVEGDTVVKALHVVSSCGDAQQQGIPSSVYAMFEDGNADYVGETFNTISSAGLGAHSHGLVDINWPEMPGMRNPVIVGWV